MPDYTLINGQKTAIPGVTENTEKVVQKSGGTTPTFVVPILCGEAPYGYPYNRDTVKEIGEADLTPFDEFVDDGEVHEMFGEGNEIAIAFRTAQEDGNELPRAWVTNLSALTRNSVVVASTGPVDEFKIYARKYGAPGNPLVKYTGGVMTVTPVDHFAMISADIGTTDTRVYVKGQDGAYSPIEWMVDGQTVYLGDSDTAYFAVTVAGKGRELDSSGQWQYWFDITAAAGTAVELAKYGNVLLYSDESETSDTYVAGEGQKLFDWINDTSLEIAAVKEGTFSGALPIAVGTATPLKDITAWGTQTAGTSPAATTADWLALTTGLEGDYWDAFRERFSLVPRLFYVGSNNSTVHGYWRSLASYRRKNRSSIMVLTGSSFTDTSLTAGDDTDITYRTAQLNRQDMVLFVGKANRLAPYLSLAAAAWGQLVNGGSLYSFTLKKFSQRSVVIGKRWTRTELNTIIKAGAVTYMMTDGASTDWVFTAGVSTIQDREAVWSAASNTTCMVAARNAIDEYWYGLNILLAAYPGTIRVRAGDLGMTVDAYNRRMLDGRGLIESYGDPSLTFDADEGAWRVTDIPLTPPAETLFIGVSAKIISG